MHKRFALYKPCIIIIPGNRPQTGNMCVLFRPGEEDTIWWSFSKHKTQYCPIQEEAGWVQGSDDTYSQPLQTYTTFWLSRDNWAQHYL